MIFYIINLDSAQDRKQYMCNQLSKFKINNFIFIKAIDGASLSDKILEMVFDINKYKKHNLWNISKEEIGCTLSHRKCLENFIESNEKTCLILEDDVYLDNSFEFFIELGNNIVDNDKPRIVLLSGWFYYSKKWKYRNDIKICKVFDARLAHAYLINKAAALLILQTKPYYVADHWGEIKELGIKIYGFSPHPVNQINKNVFKSQIQKGRPGIYDFGFGRWLYTKIRGLRRRFLFVIGNFESN